MITTNTNKMRNYLNTLIEEKGLSLDTVIEAEGKEWGTNFIPLSVVVDFLSTSSESTQAKAKANLVKIDFHNGDVMHFFKYVAQFLAQ
jgi:hypothetical protein